MEYQHQPVMLKEVINYLNPRPGNWFIDCTLGGAGYAIALAKQDAGKVLAIDLDELAIKNAEQKILELGLTNIVLAQGNFKDLNEIVIEHFQQGIKFSGIVLDLGLSSAQLADPERGFSFQNDGPLNMSFNSSPEAERIVNQATQSELTKILREYGEERYAHKIAKQIIETRKEKPIKTTKELIEVIRKAVPADYEHGRIHFATRTFQALRIAVNDELANLEAVLPQCLDLLESGGRIVVVSFHSLEDRIVKNFFKYESRDCVCPPQAPACVCGHKSRLKIITKKIVVPNEEEIADNPRARSARLRAAEKI
ncbi:MAG: 16S rRNA (cytosine(1402)-N(4))-methyltransferase RsmH [bacterium]